MGKWAESKALSDKSWEVLKENKYLLSFPVIGFAMALIPLLLFGAATITLLNADSTLFAILVGAVGLVLVSFALSFSGGAIVAAIDEEIAGRDASISFGFGKAFTRLGALFAWAMIEAAVSAVLGLMRGRGDSGASIARERLAVLGGAVWSVVTLFVVPLIMLRGEGAVQALKSSVGIVRQKWGLQVTGGVRIGARLLIMILPAVALIVLGTVLIANAGTYAVLGIPLLGLGIALAIIWALISASIRAVFSVALFHYTAGDGAYAPFNEQELEGILVKK